MAGTETFDYVSSWENIIRLWANKASQNYGNYALFSRDYDDIYQDLWVKVLERSKESEGTEYDIRKEENQAVVTKICKDTIIDMKRHDIRRSDREGNVLDISDTGNSDEEGSPSAYQELQTLGYQIGTRADYEDKVAWKILKDQYPEDSKEYKYLDFFGTYAGLEPTTKNIPPVSNKKNGWTRNAAAQAVGYASSSSNGYRPFEEKMNKIIADFLEVTEKEIESRKNNK